MMLEAEFLELAEPLWAATLALFRPSRWLPRSWMATINAIRHDRSILALPDRRYMEERIVPFLAAQGADNVLFVGTRSYTSHYPVMFARAGIALWTADIDPFAERYGAPGRHRTIDATHLTAETFPIRFDAVIFSGVIGFGLDSEIQICRAASALSDVLAPGATLILGWNSDRSPDPLTLPVWPDRFERIDPKTAPGRVTFDGASHVFDFLRRTA